MNNPKVKKFKFVDVFTDKFFIQSASGVIIFEMLSVYAMSVGLGHAGPEGGWGALAMLGLFTNFVGLGVAMILEGHIAAAPIFFWLVVGVVQTFVDLTLLFFISAYRLLKESENRDSK